MTATPMVLTHAISTTERGQQLDERTLRVCLAIVEGAMTEYGELSRAAARTAAQRIRELLP